MITGRACCRGKYGALPGGPDSEVHRASMATACNTLSRVPIGLDPLQKRQIDVLDQVKKIVMSFKLSQIKWVGGDAYLVQVSFQYGSDVPCS